MGADCGESGCVDRICESYCYRGAAVPFWLWFWWFDHGHGQTPARPGQVLRRFSGECGPRLQYSARYRIPTVMKIQWKSNGLRFLQMRCRRRGPVRRSNHTNSCRLLLLVFFRSSGASGVLRKQATRPLRAESRWILALKRVGVIFFIV